MSDLNDELKLEDLSIPGTHQACARRGGAAYVCQGLSLLGQLEAEIRFLDIRCFHFLQGFAIRHAAPAGGDIYQGSWFDRAFQAANLDDPCVLDDCIAFLTANPRECIVMSVEPEPPDSENERDAHENKEWFSDCVCKSIAHTKELWFEPRFTQVDVDPPRRSFTRSAARSS